MVSRGDGTSASEGGLFDESDSDLDLIDDVMKSSPPATGVPTPAYRPALLRWWEQSELPIYLLSVLLTCFAAFRALKLWLADFSVPFQYLNDATAVQAHFKTVLETGWYEYQPALGAPVGQNYHDFPQADNLAMFYAKFIGLVTDQVGVAVNSYYLLGFPLAAITAVWFFRVCGVAKFFSVVLSVLYAIAPFHWEKAENHLFLAAYFPVPLALGLIVMAIRSDALWGVRQGVPKLWGIVSGRGAGTMAIMALVGTASSYYSVFVLILLAPAGLVALVRTRRWRRFLGVALAGIGLVAVMVANMLPDLLYSWVHGNNLGALVRDDSESERYALKLAALLLPAPEHQFAPFARLRNIYDANYPFPGERPALGMIGAIGFVVLLAFIVVLLGTVAAAGRTTPLTAAQSRLRAMFGYLSLLTLVAFLFSTVGGFATLVSFVTSSLRSWNRMSIFIAAMALAAVGLGVTALATRFGHRRNFSCGQTRVLSAALAAVILVVGIWDQSTGKAVPAYALVQSQWHNDQDWVDELEAALPDGAAIFQLPYQAFPEAASINGVVYTDQLKPYLHSTTLRWSAGGMRGRAEVDWAGTVAAEPTAQMVADLGTTSFEGIMVDRRRYTDAGAGIENSLTRILGDPLKISLDGRYSYFSLATEKARLAAAYSPVELAVAADAVQHPVFLYPGPDVTLGLNASKETLWTTDGPTAALTLDNARSTAVQVAVSLVLTSATGASQVKLSLGNQTWVVNLTAAAASAVTIDMSAPPGRSDLLIGPGPDARADSTTFGIAKVSVKDINRPNLAVSLP